MCTTLMVRTELQFDRVRDWKLVKVLKEKDKLFLMVRGEMTLVVVF